MEPRRLECSMCYHFTYSARRLIAHYVRNHQNDPRFMVTCFVDGCGATYRKWPSFKKHVQRHHRNLGFEDAFEAPGHDLNNHNDGDANVDQLPMDDDQYEVDPDDDILQWHAAKFLIFVRDVCKTSQAALEMIVNGTQRLIQDYTNLLKDEVRANTDPNNGTITVQNLFHILDVSLPVSRIFSGIDSKFLLDKFMVDNLSMIMPQEIEIARELVWRRRPTVDYVEVVRKGYCIPFLPSLKRLLLNPQVRFCVDNPKPFQGVLRTVLDGAYYKTHEFFSSNQNSLGIILYYDELEIVNPLGSRTHKVGMFYWSLANIYPEYKPSLRAINLFAVAKYSFIQRYGISCILRQFVEDIITFQTEGITIALGDNHKTYKGSLLMVTGDTPASALLGGFKQSVSASKPCRRCMTDQERWKIYFVESQFDLRNKDTHEEHVAAIADPTLREVARNYWKQHYGVNARSSLMDVPGFDVTRCLVQDIMHVLSEGVLKVAVEKFLHFCVQGGFFSLETLNTKINLFNYGHLSKDKPSPISPQHLDNGLRQSAAQMVCLAHILPFLICDLLRGDDGAEDGDAQERLLNYVRLLQITNVCFAYEASEEDAHMLEWLINIWLSQFKRLYPDAMVPKFHFLIHVCRQIIDFGPLRQQFCIRFEAAHSWYKSLIRVVRCFKNVPWTFAYRQESWRCQQLATFPGCPPVRYLYAGHTIKEGPMVDLRSLPEPLLGLLQQEIDEGDVHNPVMISDQISIHGTEFKKDSIILVEETEDSLPSFGMITDIVVRNIDIYFAYVPFSTCYYEQTLNAYAVDMRELGAPNILHTRNLLYPHSLSAFNFQESKFVVLFNHKRTEFVE